MAETVDMHSLVKQLPEVGYLAPHRSNCGDVWLMAIYLELLPASDMSSSSPVLSEVWPCWEALRRLRPSSN